MSQSHNDPAYLANLVGALAVALTDLQREAVDATGRSTADGEALLAVYSHPGATVNEIARTTALTHSGAVRAIDRLTDLGWIERTTGSDRRTVALHATHEGSEIAAELLASRTAALAELLERLRPDDTSSLREIVTQLLGWLPHDRAGAWRICRLCDHGVCRGDACPVGSAVR